MRWKEQARLSRDSLGQESLADSRHVLDEQVTFREQCDHGQVHDLGLAEENAADIRA